MNNINTAQNQPENLKLLAAQRAAYIHAKKIYWWQIFLTGGLAVLVNFTRLLPKDLINDLLPWIVSIAVAIAIVDLIVFNNVIAKIKKNAAKIQELFDCNIFKLEWNSFNAGARPAKIFIHKNFNRYMPDPKKPIENWYDIPLDGLSQEKAILRCQETNLWYDTTLREKLQNSAFRFLIIMIILTIIIGLITRLQIGLLILFVVAPLLPFAVLSLKIYIENKKSITASNELKNAVETLKQTTDSPTMEQLRKIQDKIYCFRKDSSLVPEWFYSKKRKGLEEGMKINAESKD